MIDEYINLNLLLYAAIAIAVGFCVLSVIVDVMERRGKRPQHIDEYRVWVIICAVFTLILIILYFSIKLVSEYTK